MISAITVLCFVSCVSPSADKVHDENEIKDQLGRVITLDKPPQRIISLAPSNTEILFALGLAKRIVAVTDYCNYPPTAEAKPTIGGFNSPNIEEIVAEVWDVLNPNYRVSVAGFYRDKETKEVQTNITNRH